MARPLKPLVHSGGWYPSKKWIPLVRNGGYTTQNGGEQPEPEAVLKTVTGSLIHITDALALPAEALSVNVEPIQDLHGYDSPWPAGGGRNILNVADADIGSDWVILDITELIQLGQRFYASASITNLVGSIQIQVEYKESGTNQRIFGNSLSTATGKLEVSGAIQSFDEGTAVRLVIKNQTSASVSNFFMTYSSDHSYAPYDNICPISGRTSATIYHSGADTSDPDTYTIQLGDTVYGGTLDVTGGKMVVDRAMWTKNTATMNNNNSYPGWQNSGIKDLIGGGWNQHFTNQIMNIGTEFSANTASGNDILFLNAQTYGKTQDEWKALAIDVQIAAELATPIEITLTPTQIDMLLGENNLWADAGDLTLTYYAEGEARTSEALGILLGGTYNNPGGADDVSDDEALGILLGGS